MLLLAGALRVTLVDIGTPFTTSVKSVPAIHTRVQVISSIAPVAHPITGQMAGLDGQIYGIVSLVREDTFASTRMRMLSVRLVRLTHTRLTNRMLQIARPVRRTVGLMVKLVVARSRTAAAIKATLFRDREGRFRGVTPATGVPISRLAAA